LEKGDLGGFENLQGEEIYGKRYMVDNPSGISYSLSPTGGEGWGERNNGMQFPNRTLLGFRGI